LGYNFARSYVKPRQTIDFLFLDAYSSDELIQRIGRAGRVLALAEEDKHHPSIVYAVVDPSCYELLRPFDGKMLERSHLAELAQEMAQKHDLYAYLKTGAMAELFRPLMLLRQGMSDQDRVEFDRFLTDLQRFFTGSQDQQQRPLTSQHIRAIVRAFETRQEDYGKLRAIPPEAFTMLARHLDGIPVEWEKNATLKACIEAFASRIPKAQAQEDIGRTAPEVVAWLQKDLSIYFKEKARMSFRESFQPPLALVSDPEKLHSSKKVTTYSALHFLSYYDAPFYDTQEEWEQKTGRSAEGIDTSDVLTYCHLRKLLDTPLRIGLRLDARTTTKAQWEENYAYQVTALYRLEIVVLNDHSGLKHSVQDLLRSHFVPAFVVEQKSRSHIETLQLRRRARFYSLPLEVTFADGSHRRYAAILGTMAFLVCAEMPPWVLRRARWETQREDDSPIIC
jgi:CRISPR-associated endonuclease/helicase Cas3